MDLENITESVVRELSQELRAKKSKLNRNNMVITDL